MLKARQSPGWVAARHSDSRRGESRADGVLLDFGKPSVPARHQIDGLWVDAPSMEREIGDPALEVFKILTALNPADRRAHKSAAWASKRRGKNSNCGLPARAPKAASGRSSCWKARSWPSTRSKSWACAAKLVEELIELLKQKSGFLLLSTTDRNGLSTLCDVTLNITDRFVRELHCD